MRVICDNEKCVGCLACVVTCLDHHYGREDADAVPLRRYRAVTLPDGRSQYLTWSCHHCAAPDCLRCPFDAATVLPDGHVRVYAFPR